MTNCVKESFKEMPNTANQTVCQKYIENVKYSLYSTVIIIDCINVTFCVQGRFH